jgi:16S rRNA (cytidine1402-2'-O)-methyltransferase
VVEEWRSMTAMRGAGTLYVVSTPMGNLEDVTLRALKVLGDVDVIAAESVQHTRAFCRHYGIKSRLIGYNQHNRKARTPELVKRLESGSDMALVTNAGTPGVSDPGSFLIRRALDEGIRVSPVPGPCAVTAALSVSGFRGESFLFAGFLPNRPGRRRRELERLSSEARTLVFFEAPHRLQKMLSDLLDVLGDRPLVLVREMTKMFEEVKQGSVRSVLQSLEPGPVRGEFTVVVAGKEKEKEETCLDAKTQQRMETLLKEHRMGVTRVARMLSEETGLLYRDLYKVCLSVKRSMEGSR